MIFKYFLDFIDIVENKMCFYWNSVKRTFWNVSPLHHQKKKQPIHRSVMEKKYKSLAEFYPFYLSEHRNLTSRRLHFIGTALFLMLLIYIVWTGKWSSFWLIPLVGYGFAWVGHFFFEKNKPATFQYPFFSFASDLIMFWDTLTGQINQKMEDVIKAKNEK